MSEQDHSSVGLVTKRIITFADEVKPGDDSDFYVVCLLSVEASKLKEALGHLLAIRQEIGHHHEIGWTDLKQKSSKANPGQKELLASRWLESVCFDSHFWSVSIVCLDTSRLVMSKFGDGKGERLKNAYRRFYRACLLSHAKMNLTGYDEIKIERCYHDKEGALEIDEYFSWHPQVKISTPQIIFREDKVVFVDSDHLKEDNHPKASHFIQLADLIAGSFRYAITGLNENNVRGRVLKSILPLIERVNCSSQCRNPNSRYKHHGRINLSFFPSRQLDDCEFFEDEILRASSTYYRDYPLEISTRRKEQGVLLVE